MSRLLTKAIVIATESHDGQSDKVGLPYILHPLRVMLSLHTLEQKIVAVLHDVIEDTSTTLSDLRKIFPDVIINAVDCMTKKKNQDYKIYLRQVKHNPLAKNVKLADIRDNMSPIRQYMLDTPTQEKHKKKYVGALMYLEGYTENEN